MRIHCSESAAPQGADRESTLRTVRRIVGERLAEVVLKERAQQAEPAGEPPSR